VTESSDKLTLRLSELLEKDPGRTIKQLAEKLEVNETIKFISSLSNKRVEIKLGIRSLAELLLILLIVGVNLAPTIGTESSVKLKPLEIKGPTFAEVNETIKFIVTSKGLPVKGAVVSFAGYQKETDESGVAIFQIDFAGPFKAIARKEGYEVNSTLLWVFPRGNEGFSIRAIMVTETQLTDTIDTYRMAGANFALVKAYYHYDAQGNVYPAIIGENGWMRVSNKIHQDQLAQEISLVKAWGLKVILEAGMQYAPLFENESHGLPPPPNIFSSEEVKQRFLDQMQKEALLLTEFAENQGVDILMPIGLLECPSEEFSVYKKILPELRKKFSGKFAVIGLDMQEICFRGQPIREYDYTGFDYVAPKLVINLYTDSPLEVRNNIRKAFEFGEHLQNKYGVKILPMYVAEYNLFQKYATSYEKFFSQFSDYENAKMWLMDSIFEEASRAKVDGVETFGAWYWGIPFVPHGDWEGIQNRIYWQSKRLFNLIAEHFSHPYNKNRKTALRVLQHTELAMNYITSTFSQPILLNWASNKMDEVIRAYRSGDYSLVNSTSLEIFGFLHNTENPLNISVDGNGNEWRFLDPVYFNPPQASHLFRTKLPPDAIDAMKNLKSVYAVNDFKNLYLMLEFYGSPPKLLPYISIDTSGEWSHQTGKEYLIDLNHKILSMRKYEGLEDIWKPVDIVLSDLEVAQGDVIELKIPLKLIGNPQKVNLIVWYPYHIPPWGDVEISIVDWGTVKEIKLPKAAVFKVTDLTISPTEAEVKQKITITVKVTNVGEQTGSCTINLKVAGVIVGAETVTLAGGESTTVTFELVKEEVGTFDVEVDGQKGVFVVKETTPSPPWELYVTIAIIVIVIGVAIVIYKKMRTTSL